MVINEILFNRRWLSSRLAKIIKNFDNYDFLYNQIADNIFEDSKTFKESYSTILEINIKNQYLLKKFLTLPKELQPKNIIQTSICNNPRLIKDKLIISCNNYLLNYRFLQLLKIPKNKWFSTKRFNIFFWN